MMYEYLTDAEMKKKLKINIRKGAKKSTATGGGLLAPPPIRLPQHETKRTSVALAPPPRSFPAKRFAPAGNSTEFMPSFANFGGNMVDEEEVQTPNEAAKSEDSDPQNDITSNDEPHSNADTAAKEIEAPIIREKTNDPAGNLVKTQFAGIGEMAFDPSGDSVQAKASVISEKIGNETQLLNRIDSESSDPQNDELWNDLAVQAEAPAPKDEADNPDVTLGESPKEDETLQRSSFEVVFSDLLSTRVRKSAAAAIMRGPPAARHFGGNRGGLASQHINFGSKCDGVSPVAICGADKSVVWFTDRDPPGRTFPIGASGAVLSDVMDENQSEYMSCFLAKEKRMVVFELIRKTVVVELQMKTKLNFWRYLPPEAHGSTLAFILITPVGGFHWKPLDESPRPCQVWKRCPELESKKILSYEEGGSNGKTGASERSTVALVLASSATPRSAVEAYLIPMKNESSQFCISNVILGAALYRPPASPSSFLPFVVTITKDVTSQHVLDIEDLWEESNTLARGIIASTVLMGGANLDDSYATPSMSMGPLPEALCCCHDDFIVAVIRKKGLVFAYDFSSGDLVLVGNSELGQYIVDAAIRSSNVDGEVELVLLLCESDDSRDGRVATVNISREDGLSCQNLSSF